MKHLSTILFLVLSAAPAAPQSNAVPGLDVKLGSLENLKVWGHVGTFPAGAIGVSFGTTICNVGSVPVGWFQPMNPDHPMGAFLIAREENGRMVQISDRSYVKHVVYPTNGSLCTQCNNPGGNTTHLMPGCSDTYGFNPNGGNYLLGPPDEIDPFLATWAPLCSLFDRGDPPVASPADCDGVRDYTTAQANAIGPVHHRVELADADLDRPAATFWYQAMYLAPGEPEANRADNVGSKQMLPSWDGTQWTIAQAGIGVNACVLERWSGASVASAANGADDGAVFVAAAVTGPVAGLYHYEYAFYNRDNARGIGAVRIPVHPLAQVVHVGFRDIDADPANDWSFAHAGGELAFSTGANPLQWNTIYNVWFDCDAGPQDQALALDQFLPGPGAASFAVVARTPTDACAAAAVYCTAKTNSLGCTPAISATGTASASAGAGFVIAASSELSRKSGLLFYGSAGQQALPFQGGFLCVVPPLVRTNVQDSGGNAQTDCTGTYALDFNVWIASGADPSLVAGTDVGAQWWARDPGFAPPDNTSLSAGLEFTVCP